MDMPTTLIEAVRYFSDTDRCEALMRNMRWPTGTIRCPECNSDNIGEIKTRRLLRCRDCRRQIYPRRGTIFGDSPLALDKWLVAVAIFDCKDGISSHGLARSLGIQQKTAWFMLHRIRVAMEIGRAENTHTTTGTFETKLKLLVSVRKEKVEARIAQKRAARLSQREAFRS